MPQFSEIKATFKPGAHSNTGGVGSANGQTLTVEFLSADPTLVSGQPRVWVNTTSGTLKFTHNGSTVKTVTAT